MFLWRSNISSVLLLLYGIVFSYNVIPHNHQPVALDTTIACCDAIDALNDLLFKHHACSHLEHEHEKHDCKTCFFSISSVNNEAEDKPSLFFVNHSPARKFVIKKTIGYAAAINKKVPPERFRNTTSLRAPPYSI